jgi:hypothetical protein
MKIRFRKIQSIDLENIMLWRMLPEVTLYMYTDPRLTLEDQKRWYKIIKSDQTKKYWIINVDNEDVGLVSIYNIDIVNRRCDWGYYLASEAIRGKGIARAVELNLHHYVFEILNMNKLCCEVFAWNDFVIGIHRKYGSSIEGKRRLHICKNGEFHDIVEMAILREDWEENLRGKFEFTRAVIE